MRESCQLRGLRVGGLRSAVCLAPCLFLCWGNDDSSCRGQAARFTTGTLLTSLKIGNYWGSCDHVRGDADEKLGLRFAANAQKALL